MHTYFVYTCRCTKNFLHACNISPLFCMYFLLVNNFKSLSVAVKEEQSHRERLNELMRLKEELVKQVKLEEEKYNIINFSLKLCL